MPEKQETTRPIPASASRTPAEQNGQTAPQAQSTVRILIIDDHPIVRSGIRMLVEKRADFVVIGEAEGRTDALAILERERPEIILLDVDLGAENGLDFLTELLETAELQSRLILLTGSRDPEDHARAIRSGALGVVNKEHAPEALLKAIDKVNQGEVWLERAMVATALNGMWHSSSGAANKDPEADKIESLTPREHEVIALIGKGLKNQQIADSLFLSEATVRRHLSSIFEKLEVSDRLDLVVYAFQHGLVKLDR